MHTYHEEKGAMSGPRNCGPSYYQNATNINNEGEKNRYPPFRKMQLVAGMPFFVHGTYVPFFVHVLQVYPFLSMVLQRRTAPRMYGIDSVVDSQPSVAPPSISPTVWQG